MADIRIKDLTTTASTTAADDFFAADGTTNGTRKLSAYSPTFGGNATVGGTLTVTGNATVGGANVTQGALASLPAGAYLSAETSSGEGYLTSYNGTSAAYLPINYRSSEHKFTSNGAVKVQSTTASTSTSSGALVVSGGVGVAGAIVTGGIVRCGGSNGLSLGSDTGNIRIDTAGPAGVEFRGLSSADTITGFTMREMALIDGATAPSTRAGYATIYVDSADGDLKVKFGDGTVKTIATDS